MLHVVYFIPCSNIAAKHTRRTRRGCALARPVDNSTARRRPKIVQSSHLAWRVYWQEHPSRWALGETPIPAWVPSYLGMALDIRRIAARLEPPKSPKV
jgi:hypothetical protein